MCLAVAGQVMKIAGDAAMVDFDGLQKRHSTLLLPNLAVGDYVLVHAGFIIQKLEPAYALELIELDKEVGLYDQ
ncbi:MAG: HypC/HybG/HupF family hydrogenase formation chaperone [Clostridiales bacterium]|nr:HypC/HybG/HupF family hydrogenase formation chaperone [Clostridiales bacterium]